MWLSLPKAAELSAAQLDFVSLYFSYSVHSLSFSRTVFSFLFISLHYACSLSALAQEL